MALAGSSGGGNAPFAPRLARVAFFLSWNFARLIMSSLEK